MIPLVLSLASYEAKFAREALLDLEPDATPQQRRAATERHQSAERAFAAAMTAQLRNTGRLPR